MVFSLEDFRAIHPHRAPAHMVFSVHKYIQGRSSPDETSPKNAMLHWVCSRTVLVLQKVGNFLLIDEDGNRSWIREEHVVLAACVQPHNQDRQHIKVRQNATRDETWLNGSDGKPLELARCQWVALLELNQDTKMVKIGFMTAEQRPKQGWVKLENLRPNDQ
jgi:hypothetical protein